MTEPTPGSEQLNLKVKSQDGEEVFFKIKTTTQLKKLMDAYCQRQSVIFPSYLVINQQCSFPFRRRKTSWDSNTQGTQHGKWWWNRCRCGTSWRRLLNTQKWKNQNESTIWMIFIYLSTQHLSSLFTLCLFLKKTFFLVKNSI